VTDATLVINAGSSSIKFAAYTAGATPERKLRGSIDGLGTEPHFAASDAAGKPFTANPLADATPALTHEQALERLFAWIDAQCKNLRIVAAGHRVVHGADQFTAPVLVNDAILAQLDKLVPLARLHQPHNLAAIRALARLPDVHLLLAGEGVERDNLVELAARENVSARLHLLGWRRDMGALLAASEILVCPSRHEPLGNVVLEAFSANRPVVASAADGPRELIVPGEQGLLVPVGDVEALANGIRLTLDHTAMAQRFAEAGRTLYEAEYAQPRVLARWQEFLHTVRKAG